MRLLPVVWFVALCLSAGLLPTRAQEAPAQTETYTWRAGGVAFEHPANWVVRDDTFLYGSVSVATQPGVLDATPIPEGELFIQVAPVVSTSEAALARFGVDSLTPEGALAVINAPGGQVQPFELDGRLAARLDAESSGQQITFITVEGPSQQIYSLYAAAASGSFAAYEAEVLALAASIRPAEPLSTPGRVESLDRAPRTFGGAGPVAGVTWQYTAAFDAADAAFTPTLPERFGRLHVGTDDTLYVATGGSALLVFDVDGVLLRAIHNPDVHFDDVYAAEDGTLWVIDRSQAKVIHLSAEGDILTAFGQVGSGADQFTPGGPSDLVIGADGLLYILTTTFARQRTYDDVQVRTPEGDLERVFTAQVRSGGQDPNAQLRLLPDGNLLVTAGGGGTLARIYDLETTEQVAALPLPEVEFVQRALAVGPEGIIYTAGGGAVIQLGPDGGVLAVIGGQTQSAESALPPGALFDPTGIGVLSDGSIVVADANQAFWQVVRFDIRADRP
ncbi:MAG: hypothetical protein ACOCYT_00105 [Chloroflexota bacterium]